MKAIIWGAGNVGKAIFYSFSKAIEVCCFVDKNQLKIGQSFCGLPVKSIDALKTENYDVVIIANTHGASIKEYLAKEVPTKTVIDFLNEGLFDSRICTFNLLADEIESNNIAGAVAEAGVYKGDFTKFINARFSDKKLYLFDTFSGFAESDMNTDEKMNLSANNAKLFTDSNVSIVKEKLTTPENAVFKIGYFPETAEGLENETYCFVSIDFDLYTPTMEAVKYFYTHLTAGGYIMLHDFHNDDFLGVKKAISELKSELHFAYIPIPDGGGSIVIGKPC